MAACARASGLGPRASGLGFRILRPEARGPRPRSNRPSYFFASPYFIALLAAGAGFAALERRVPSPRPSARAALANAALVVAGFLLPPLLHAHELILTLVAVAVLAARLAVDRAPGDALVLAAVVISDLLIEGGLIAAGFFRYAHASLGPFPLWLAPLWGGLGLALRRLFRRL